MLIPDGTRFHLKRPYGTQILHAVSFPTLKRGANKRCAYGATTAVAGIFIAAIEDHLASVNVFVPKRPYGTQILDAALSPR